jgi:mRNA interferase HigB
MPPIISEGRSPDFKNIVTKFLATIALYEILSYFCKTKPKPTTMEITQRYKLYKLAEKHSDVLKPLNNWIQKVEQANWKNHNDLKADFPTADYVRNNRYVFNIKGNNYRIVVIVIFFVNEINIRFAGTHSEYDKINVSTI